MVINIINGHYGKGDAIMRKWERWFSSLFGGLLLSVIGWFLISRITPSDPLRGIAVIVVLLGLILLMFAGWIRQSPKEN